MTTTSSWSEGFVTIPLPCTDVPFHSRYLWAGVMPFQVWGSLVHSWLMNADETFVDLGKKINPLHLDLDMFNQTSSPCFDKVLRRWNEKDWGSAEQCQQLAHVILIELLAYQFASPVRWIETQVLLFTAHGFQRSIEIGSSPTPAGMATWTLKAKYEAREDLVSHSRAVLCHAKNAKEVYYQFEDEVSVEDVPEPAATKTPAPAIVTQTATVAAPAAATTRIEDVPVKSLEILAVIIAEKLKKLANEVPLSKSIKDLVGGNQLCKMRFSVTLVKNLAPPLRKVKSLRSRRLVLVSPETLVSAQLARLAPDWK